jgi:antitoxin component YwqK of YwqJK toxin-antitoxin module
MKKVVLVLVGMFFMTTFSFAQHITDETSKSYYDEAKTKLKEVYSFVEVNTFSPKGDQQIVGTKMKKHGPYFYYYENGKLKIQGNYKKDKKHKTWTYYDETGKVIKVEEYLDGELVSSK